MHANKKGKYECVLIEVLGKLYKILNRTIFFVFGTIKNNFRPIKNNFWTQQEMVPYQLKKS